MPVSRINGTDIYYEVAGTGTPIVFTHGHSMYRKQWEPQVAALSSRYQTIVWDVRGHGDSGLPPGEVDPEDFSRDLKGLLDHLELRSAVLCGLSMGGHISLQTAVRYPDYVQGLILIGTPFTNTFNRFERYAAPFSQFSLRYLPFGQTAKWTASAMSSHNPSNRDFVLESFGKMTKDGFLRHWSGNLRMESRDDLHRVACLTLILHGEHDNMVGRQQPYLREHIRRAVFHSIPNAHHLTNRDNPEAVNRHIEEFMMRLTQV
ncbi:alpha/beta hydrolase [Paenibacillus sp. MY03]|jgi:3-oxoadipate enol-lactonase|uniref:alpha/beta fold hydrolase n=1 Tax=Paenibacillus sp. MY03 TaxID=302980 RepID=UPI000B3C21A6|nr:alpha/beta hydrolase [Paenibacillus sp. MY03]OUS68405.1 alpha/beta hydrolase [Paenibacillus sp. MY03]